MRTLSYKENFDFRFVLFYFKQMINDSSIDINTCLDKVFKNLPRNYVVQKVLENNKNDEIYYFDFLDILESSENPYFKEFRKIIKLHDSIGAFVDQILRDELYKRCPRPNIEMDKAGLLKTKHFLFCYSSSLYCGLSHIQAKISSQELVPSINLDEENQNFYIKQLQAGIEVLRETGGNLNIIPEFLINEIDFVLSLCD